LKRQKLLEGVVIKGIQKGKNKGPQGPNIVKEREGRFHTW